MNFIIGECLEISNLVNLRNKNYLSWALSRYLADSREKNVMPSWSASNSAKYNMEINSISTAFISILPHPATSYDSIFTSITNFRNIMKQTGNISGTLWCDEGVCHIAREIQLLSSDSFDVFLGLGGFHTEKGFMTCLRKCLKGTRIDKVLINTKIYGPVSTEIVLNGGHYANANRAYSLIAEISHVLQLDTFFTENDKMQYHQFIDCVMCLRNLFQNRQINQNEIEMKWNECQLLSCTLGKDFKNFVKKGIDQNIKLTIWNKFLTKLYLILRDLTRSHREGDWLLHLSTLERAFS